MSLKIHTDSCSKPSEQYKRVSKMHIGDGDDDVLDHHAGVDFMVLCL